jgi:hypothetical protein
VIAAGLGAGQRAWSVTRVLSIPPLRYVGDRSYTFYLWHWPVLILAAGYAGEELPLRTNLVLLEAAFLLSVVTYALFENPIRRARLGAPASAMLWPASIAAVVLVAVFTLQSIYTKTLRVEAIPASTAAPLPTAGQAKPAAIAAQGGALPAVVAAVQAAERGQPIPAGLTPPVGDLLSDENLYLFPSGCTPANDSQITSAICTMGVPSATRSIVVIGDSHAQMWMPTILDLAERDGWAVRPIVKSACTPYDWTGEAGSSQCHAWYRWAVRQAQALRPDVALITGSYGEASSSDGSDDSVKNALLALTASLKHSAKRVVLLGDDPGIQRQPVDCLLARGATMRSCTAAWPPDRFAVNADLASLAKAAGFGFVATAGWFCFNGRCPTVVGHTIAYRDTNHITKTYALELAAPFRSAFRRAIRPG